VHGIVLIVVGIVVGIINSLLLECTIKKFTETKKSAVIFLSFLLRMIFICATFVLFINKNWKNAVCILAGLTIATACFIIRKSFFHGDGNKS